jgi:hypothetical protein
VCESSRSDLCSFTLVQTGLGPVAAIAVRMLGGAAEGGGQAGAREPSVTELDVWHEQLHPKFLTLQLGFEGWLAVALSMLSRAIDDNGGTAGDAP